MVSCIEIETASLVFASLSVLITSLGSLVCVTLMVHVDVLMANLTREAERKWPTQIEAVIRSYSLYINVSLAVILSIMAVSLAFSVILTKGLLSKNAHLVKAYFVYGVTKHSLLLFLILCHLFTNVTVNMQYGLLSLFGCFVYSLILVMIRKTYLKLANTEPDQFCHKKLEAEKSIA